MIDWSKKRYSVSKKSNDPIIKICIGADWAPLGEHKTLMIEKPYEIYHDLLSILQNNDLKIVKVLTEQEIVDGMVNCSGDITVGEFINQG